MAVILLKIVSTVSNVLNANFEKSFLSVYGYTRMTHIFTIKTSEESIR